MLICEGHKMFKGVMKITRINGNDEHIEGTWLYKPEYECWYCKGSSYPQSVCTILIDNTQ
jgi:hypothetical protein